MLRKVNTYIQNLEGANIYSVIYHNENVEDEKDKKIFDTSTYNQVKLYSATMPYSLQMERLADSFAEEIYRIKNKQYTDAFINVNFEYNFETYINDKDKNDKPIERKIKVNKKEIRKELYTEGFINGNLGEYQFFMRGAAKARTGSAIFCKTKVYDTLIKRNRLNLDFADGEETNITELNSYQSLVTSGIIDILKLKPNEILIIDDIYGKEVESPASVTKWIEQFVEVPTGKNMDKTKIIDIGYLETKTDKHYKQTNCLTDGESLLDESVFLEKAILEAQIKKYKGKFKLVKTNKLINVRDFKTKKDKLNIHMKSMFLLRNDYLKSCSFNSKLRAFWKSKGIETIVEKLDGVPTGRILKCNEIKIVITPNSLKWLKNVEKFTKENFSDLSKEQKADIKINCYKYWLNNIDSIFGIVKYDKQGNFGTYNRLTYQLLNSFPNLKYDDVKELVQDEINYVMNLKNIPAYFRNYIKSDFNKVDEMEKDFDNYFKDENQPSDITDKYKSVDTFSNLLLVNSNIQYSKEFKSFKDEIIGYYINNLRHGKIRIKDTIYATIFANPYEFLQATIGEYVQGKSIAKGTEMYCKFYDNHSIDIEEGFCVSRNPHIQVGNIMHMTFKKHDEYKWFNLSDNIIVVNITDNDLPARGQGFDEDSDTLLICPNKKLAKLSKECQKYPTPINGIKGVTTPRKNTMKDLAELDGMLQSNYIGKICNKAQIINSYMNEAIANELDQKIIDELFDASSKLSSLSQVEIDKAKKSFDNIKMAKELGKINHIEVELGDKKVTILDFVEGVVLKGKTTKEKKLIKSSIRNYIRKVKNDKHIHYNFDREYTDLKIAPVKMIVPNFFDVVAEDNTYRSFRTFKTPMDYLQQILDEEIVNKTRDDKGTTKDKKTKKNNQKPPKFRDLLVKDKSLDCKSNVSQKDDIFKIIEECGKTINGLKVKNKKDKNGNPIKLNKNAKKTIIRNAKEKALNDLIFTFNKTKQVERKINSATILQILREAFPTAEKKKEKTAENKKIKEQNESITDKDKKIKKVTTFSDYARLTLTLLYNAKIFETLRCFKNDTNEDEEILIRDFKGDINIFGEKYSLKTRKDLILKEESTAE